MSSQDRWPVVVGYDGSDAAQAAVAVAAGEAALRGLRLQIVHVVDRVPAGKLSRTTQRAAAVAAGQTLLDEAAELARPLLGTNAPGLELVPGDAVDEFLARSGGAELLVVGEGRQPTVGVLLGSVALAMVTRARCPVVVVRSAWETGSNAGGPVVVGVDGLADSEDALAAAYAAAELRHAQLIAVHTWHYPTSSAPGDMMPLVYDPAELAAEETAILREAVRPFREKFPFVPATERGIEGAASPTLVAISAGAQLLVVGTRGRGPVRSVLLGSVGLAVVQHSHCPVLVARSPYN